VVETNDQGRFPEDPSIPRHWEEVMAKNYSKRLKESRARYQRMFEEYERQLRR